MNVKRVTRLLHLLQTLQAGNGQNADGLAETLNVTRRTVFRDLQSLKEAGFPLEFDEERQRYSLPGSYFLPPTNFSAEEALAIIGLTLQLGQRDGLPFYEAASRAAHKLELNLPAELREEIRKLTRSIAIKPAAINRHEGQDAYYQQLMQAQAQRRKVRIAYRSKTEWETIHTNLRPYQLFFSKHAWYVIGRSSLHREVRTFHLARIASLELQEGTFPDPRFNLAKHFRNAWQMIPEAGPDSEVHLRFQSLVAGNVAEVQWHKTQRHAFRDDGTLDFYVTVSGVNEISWWILGYGDQVEVLKPTKLRTLIKQRIASMARMYDKKNSAGESKA